jgi:hypothetical protein
MRSSNKIREPLKCSHQPGPKRPAHQSSTTPGTLSSGQEPNDCGEDPDSFPLAQHTRDDPAQSHRLAAGKSPNGNPTDCTLAQPPNPGAQRRTRIRVIEYPMMLEF